MIGGARRSLDLVLPSFVLLCGWFLLLQMAHWNQGLSTSYDLGIFSQIAAAYSRAQFPVPHLLGYPALADHFSPINVLWGLGWLMWPDPRMLLVMQACSLAAGIVIMAAVAKKMLPGLPLAGWAVVLLGGLGGQVIPSVLFDVHEVSLGLPAMSLLCAALLLRRGRLLIASGVLLVLVKEDLGLTVAAAGLLWIWQSTPGQRRPGVVVTAIGSLGLIVAALSFRLFSATGTSPQAAIFSGPSPGQPWLDWGAAVVTGRMAPALLFLAATGLIGVTSRLALLALPTLIWRIVSSRSTHWSIEYHYDLLIWPVAMIALIDAGRHWWGSDPRGRPTRLLGFALALGLAASIAVGVGLMVHRHVSLYGVSGEAQAVRDMRSVAASIPSGSSVAAQNSVGVYILTSYDLYQYSPNGSTSGLVDYLLLGKPDDFAPTPCAREALDSLLASGSGQVIAQRGGYTAIKLSHRQQLPAACS